MKLHVGVYASRVGEPASSSSDDQAPVLLKPSSRSIAVSRSRHASSVPNFSGNVLAAWGERFPGAIPFIPTLKNKWPSGSTIHQRWPTLRARKNPAAGPVPSAAEGPSTFRSAQPWYLLSRTRGSIAEASKPVRSARVRVGYGTGGSVRHRQEITVPGGAVNCVVGWVVLFVACVSAGVRAAAMNRTISAAATCAGRAAPNEPRRPIENCVMPSDSLQGKTTSAGFPSEQLT